MGDTIFHRCLFVVVIVFAILVAVCCTQPWFMSTNVTHINTCCRVKYTTTGYIFKDYTFSSTIKKSSNETTCNQASCSNLSTENYTRKLETKIEQDEYAKTALWVVKIVPALIMIHIIYYFGHWFLCAHKTSQTPQTTTVMVILTLASSLSLVGVVIYATVYRNQIGFHNDELTTGWFCATFLCSVNEIVDLIILIVLFSKACNKYRKKQLEKRRNNIRVSAKDWKFVKQKRVKKRITANNLKYVKNDNQDSVIEFFPNVDDHVYFHPSQTDSSSNKIVDPEDIAIPFNTYESSNNELINTFQDLIDIMWKKHLVGKGVDARNLSHSTLKVNSVQWFCAESNTIARRYIGFRSFIQEKVKTNGQLPCLNDFKCHPLQTTKFIDIVSTVTNKCAMLFDIQKVDEHLNEYFLFHGTKECNAETILKSGFDISKVRSSFLGKGIYFTESPVKADQYSGASSTTKGCILLCRVILGNFIIRKTRPGWDMRNFSKPPCARCLNLKCLKHSSEERFDSVIYDNPKGLLESLWFITRTRSLL